MSTRFEELSKEMLKKGLMRKECPVQMHQLALVEVPYKNFDGENKVGEILVLKTLEKNVLRIFQRLVEIDFRIHSIILINEFGGDDNKSMEANNSSSFNCRNITGTDRYSKHSYGVAIDINPVQNPFISENGKVLPKEGEKFLDRDDVRIGMITSEVVDIFSENGFSVWGGDWKSMKDYHHFEVSDDQIPDLTGRLLGYDSFKT